MAVRFQPCDELGANLAAANEDWHFSPNLVTAERLIEAVSKNYRADRFEQFEELLERALDFEGVTDRFERHGYKMALGLFFNNRAQHARKRKRDMEEIPFAPQ